MLNRFVSALSLSLLAAAVLPAQLTKRGYVTGKYALELDGKNEGWLSSVAGGNPTSDVVTEKLGPDNITRKHIGGVKYEPIVLEASPELAATALQMLLDNKFKRLNGAVIATDFDYKEVSRLNFFQTLVTAVTIPDLDAGSKDACHFDIELTPEYTRTALGSGGTTKPDVVTARLKSCLVSNFRVKIDNLNTTKVSKVESFTLRRSVVANPVGEMRDYQKEPARLTIPNIKLTVASSTSKDFTDWLEDFVVKGNNSQEKEKTLTLEIMTPNLSEALLTLTASGVGIVAVRRVATPAGSDNIARDEVELYVEQWTVTPVKRASLDTTKPPVLAGSTTKVGRD
ncbi:MAG: phage tail protein [Gemmatimonadaceae bacterium]